MADIKDKITTVESLLALHEYNKNTYETKKDVEDLIEERLSNVDNTSDADKPISTATQTALNGKADNNHTHDDRYYTESEIDTKLNGKANSSHGNHVPATQTANNAIFLRNDNKWATITPANIGAAAAHSHPYVPTAGGTMTGALTVNNTLYANGNSSNTQAIVLPNSKYIHAKSTNTTVCSILGISSGNNVFLGYSGTDGELNNTNIYAGGYVRMYSNQNDPTYRKGQGVELYREGDPVDGVYREIFCPNTNATHWLGASSKRWNTGFFTNAITSSDLKEKEVIEDFDFKAKDFIMGLEPIAYRRIGNGDTGERIHLGLGAQTLANHIKDIDIGDLSMVQASIINDDGTESPYYGEEIDDAKLSWGINYTELIAPMIKMIQEQQKEIDNLKRDIETLKSI